MLPLNGNGRKPPLTLRCQLRGSWAKPDAAWPAVVARPASIVAGDTPVINGSYSPGVDIGDRAVVIERAASPIAAPVAITGIPKAVVNASVEADHRPPIASVPDIHAVCPAPIAGGP